MNGWILVIVGVVCIGFFITGGIYKESCEEQKKINRHGVSIIIDSIYHQRDTMTWESYQKIKEALNE